MKNLPKREFYYFVVASAFIICFDIFTTNLTPTHALVSIGTGIGIMWGIALFALLTRLNRNIQTAEKILEIMKKKSKNRGG
jgi:hypothetical protein